MTEFELLEQFKTTKISWPLLYRTLLLVSRFSAVLKSDIELSKYGRSAGGKMIRNTRAYRRAGGALDTAPKQVTQDYKKAWILFRSRAEDIAKWLYARKEKNIASPIYAFAKQYSSQGIQKAGPKFLGRSLDGLVSQVLTRALQLDLKDPTIKAAFYRTTDTLEVRQGNRLVLEAKIKDGSPYLDYKAVSVSVRKAL